MGLAFLRGYLAGISDFDFLGNGFPLDPQRNQWFAEGSTATNPWLPFSPFYCGVGLCHRSVVVVFWRIEQTSFVFVLSFP